MAPSEEFLEAIRYKKYIFHGVRLGKNTSQFVYVAYRGPLR